MAENKRAGLSFPEERNAPLLSRSQRAVEEDIGKGWYTTLSSTATVLKKNSPALNHQVPATLLSP